MAILSEAIGSMDISLNPGDFHFHCPVPGKPQPTKLKTLLGSCVSIIVWHPERRLAGMSHAVLPSRCMRGGAVGSDGRFCDEAVSLLCQEISRAAARPQHFHAYLVGGGQMYLTRHGMLSIGDRNIDAARSYLKEKGFVLRAEHVGMDGYRKVAIDLSSGVVTVTFGNKQINLTAS